jgi:hypothetical protein
MRWARLRKAQMRGKQRCKFWVKSSYYWTQLFKLGVSKCP